MASRPVCEKARDRLASALPRQGRDLTSGPEDRKHGHCQLAASTDLLLRYEVVFAHDEGNRLDLATRLVPHVGSV